MCMCTVVDILSARLNQLEHDVSLFLAPCGIEEGGLHSLVGACCCCDAASMEKL